MPTDRPCSYCGDADLDTVHCWACEQDVCVECAALHNDDHLGAGDGD